MNKEYIKDILLYYYDRISLIQIECEKGDIIIPTEINILFSEFKEDIKKIIF